jgi:hypothetical protein
MALTHLSALTTTPHTEVVREIMTSPTPKNHHLGAVTVHIVQQRSSGQVCDEPTLGALPCGAHAPLVTLNEHSVAEDLSFTSGEAPEQVIHGTWKGEHETALIFHARLATA